jgi:hypothetical protein
MRIRFLKLPIIAGLMVLSILLWAGSCRQAGSGPPEILRIIDLLRREHVVSSPLWEILNHRSGTTCGSCGEGRRFLIWVPTPGAR